MVLFLIFACSFNRTIVVEDSALARVAEYKYALEAAMAQVVVDLRRNPAVDPVVVAQAELELTLFHRRFAPWTLDVAASGLTKIAVGVCVGPGECGGFGIATLPGMDVGYSTRSHLLVVSPGLAVSDPLLPFMVFGALSSALADINAGEPSPNDTPVMAPEAFEQALIKGVTAPPEEKKVWM